jgi:hypothetical protein
MIMRRDGSIDLRVLVGRVASYGAVTMMALAVGVLIAFAT